MTALGFDTAVNTSPVCSCLKDFLSLEQCHIQCSVFLPHNSFPTANVLAVILKITPQKNIKAEWNRFFQAFSEFETLAAMQSSEPSLDLGEPSALIVFLPFDSACSFQSAQFIRFHFSPSSKYNQLSHLH